MEGGGWRVEGGGRTVKGCGVLVHHLLFMVQGEGGARDVFGEAVALDPEFRVQDSVLYSGFEFKSHSLWSRAKGTHETYSERRLRSLPLMRAITSSATLSPAYSRRRCST